ncbi:MAG: hypothetical protein L0216_07885 [Planctomycetales bacterium]|nr:hypothetical protein [Planctomycetales bacterium]
MMRICRAVVTQAVAGVLIAGLAGAARAQVAYSPGPNNPSPSNESASGQNIVVLQIQVTNNASEAAVIQSLTIGTQGTLNDATGISAVDLYVDLNGNGWLETPGDLALVTGQTFATDDGNLTFTNLNRTIAVGASELWIVVEDMSGSGVDGDTWVTHLGTSTTLSAVGATSGSNLTITGVSVNGGRKTVSSTGCTQWVLGAPLSVTGQPTAGATAWPIAALEIRTSTANAETVTSITVTASGTGNDLTEVSRVRLFRDTNGNGVLELSGASPDPEIGPANVGYNADNGTAPLSGLNETIAAGSRAFYIVAYDFSSTLQAGSTFTLSVASASDLVRSGAHSPSCQTHGPPTTHGTTTAGGPGSPPPTTTDPATGPTGQPRPGDSGDGHPPMYCCPVWPMGQGGGGPGPGTFFLAWGPLLLLASAILLLRRHRPAWATRRR